MAAFVKRQFRFECHLHPETRIEIGAILKVDGHLGAIAAIFKDAERPDDFSGNVFAINHEITPGAMGNTVA
jgi:hypothetical protein